MKRTKSYDTPLSELTLRRYEKPYELDKRELVRKLCLSIGLLNPGDSRDVVVDILYVMLIARKGKNPLPSEMIREQVIDLRKSMGLDEAGTAGSNIRRQLKRLRDLFLIEKVKSGYAVLEYESLANIFEEKIEKFLLQSIRDRVKEYLLQADKEFSK